MQMLRIFPARNGGRGTIQSAASTAPNQTQVLLTRLPKSQQPCSGLTPSRLVSCLLKSPHSWEVNILKHMSPCNPFFHLLDPPGAFPQLPDKCPASQAALSCCLPGLSPATSALTRHPSPELLGAHCGSCMFAQAVLTAEIPFPALNLASDLEQTSSP